MIRALTLTFLFVLFLLPQSAKAQEQVAVPVGAIAEIEGTAALQHQGETTTPQIGQEVFLGDVIETGADSKTLILFIDNTELTLSENARLRIDEYVFDTDTPENNKGRFSILHGAFIFVTGLINKTEKPDVKIETPYGSIGIRGTIVWGGPIDDEYNVFLQEGSVSFATKRGRVILKPGEGTKAYGKNAIPDRAKAWGQEKIDRAVKTISLKDAAAVKERVLKMKQSHAEMRKQHIKAIREKNMDPRERIRQENKLRQENNLPAKDETEKRTEIKERMELKRQEIQERGATTAPDFEQREKRHLQQKTPRAPK